MALGRIGYTSPYLPPEIIWASGLAPMRLRPGESLAGADGYLPRNFSIEARALLAAALEQQLTLEAVILLDEDDTSRRLYDVWRAYSDIPVMNLVALPRLDTDLARGRYVTALAELGEELASLSGAPLSSDSLREAIALYNEQRRLWGALRQRWIEGQLSTTDWYDLRWTALTGDPVSVNEQFAETLDSISSIPVRTKGGPRLLVLGGMHIPRSFLAFLEACGARVAAEDSEADERILTEAVPCSPGCDLPALLDALAAAYLTRPPGPRPSALERRLALLGRLLDERGVQGVIALYPKFADAYAAEYVILSEVFRSRGLPALLLDDDGESGLSGQQRTRVEALLEVIA